MLSEIILNCIERSIPVPAYESFFDKKTLPRRYFIFFDVLYQAGRHNKQLWKVITELNNGENQVPYGSCIFEAHVMTTLQENYYKWLFLLLSDIDEVKDEHYEERFITEYECGDSETGELPEELIDYQETNTRLPKNLEIYYDEEELDKRKLLKVRTNMDEVEEERMKQREKLELLVKSVKNEHRSMLIRMREKIRNLREMKKGIGRPTSRLSDEDIKKVVSVEKRKLIQFRNESDSGDRCEPPEPKRRKSLNDHKSRCTDMKVQFFQKTKEMLDKEEEKGLIESWERVYKYIINKHVNIKTKDGEPVLKEPSKMLNELSKAVDLDELIDEEQNLYHQWTRN